MMKSDLHCDSSTLKKLKIYSQKIGTEQTANFRVGGEKSKITNPVTSYLLCFPHNQIFMWDIIAPVNTNFYNLWI